MTVWGYKAGPWVILLFGVACGYAAGWIGSEFKGGINPVLVFMLENAALPGFFFLSVTGFMAGAYALDWVWTRLIWLWLKHKHQAAIRARLRASARASESRTRIPG